MSYAGFGPSALPFDMFQLARSADEARRDDKLRHIYHRGQELAWDGRQVLADLIRKHGGVHLEQRKAQALSRLFGVLMWGELAAWKISAQLADRLVPLEAKMAATSQVHDEARHFYVLHDYLRELGQEPGTISRSARALLDLVLDTDDVRLKLLGMQLLIETLALTVFQAVRESGVEPVLCELLRYFEKDEARHVGLGVQYLPALMRGVSRPYGVWLLGRQVQLLLYALAELKGMEPDLVQVGLDPRRISRLGMAKQMSVYDSLYVEMGGRPGGGHEVANRLLVGLSEALFPPEEARANGSSLRATYGRLASAARILRRGLVDAGLPEAGMDQH